MRSLSVFLFVVISSFVWTQSSLTTVSGYAPAYIDQYVSVLRYTDFLTQTTEKVGEALVKADSTFSISFFNDEIGKFKVMAGNNYFSIYAEPDAEYELFIKNRSPYVDYRPAGNEVEFFFLGLDSLDINFKIIDFEDRMLTFLKRNYNRQAMANSDFVKSLDEFKEEIEQLHAQDSTAFFQAYVRYSFAGLDNMAFLGARNKYEKYDFYIKNQPIYYENDRYIEYVLKYYEKYHTQLAESVNQEFYSGIISASPTKIMRSLGRDYALENMVLREFVMLKMLSDVYYTNEYPQTNILTILDSLSIQAIVPEHESMAKNLRKRLTQLVPGSKMPEFNIKVNKAQKSKADYLGKHLYIQFSQQGSLKSERDYELLSYLREKYGDAVDFLTIVVAEDGAIKESTYLREQGISWDAAVVNPSHTIIESFNVVTFPHYVLVDAQGYIVSAPALSPRPNNEYDTVERNFFEIKKILDRLKKEEDK
jgi:hypothetical protein